MSAQKEKKDKNMIEAVSAVGESIPTEGKDEQDIILAQLEENPNFVRDVLSLKNGEHVIIEVTEENYKQKYFRISNRDKNLIAKKCRMCGVAKNNLYGLGVFIKPEDTHKVFPLFVNDYIVTWKAYYIDK